MGTRTVDIEYFKDIPHWMIPFEPALEGGLPEGVFERRFEHLENWLTTRCKGTFLMLMKHVVFDNEEDAMFFQLGYRCVD